MIGKASLLLGARRGRCEERRGQLNDLGEW